MRYFITFAYDGSRYKGYQKQPKTKTVQGEIEKALKTINGNKKVDIHASGRTDAGVHAINQKAHFDLEMKHITPEKLRDGLNSLLPKDIYIKDINIVDDEFHARYNVKAKEYVYIINMGEYNPIEKDYVYQYNKKLDVVEMERALKYLEGSHNFKSFTKSDDEREDYTRTIVQTNLIRDIKNVNKITVSFLGTGFLRYQVRNMIGTLIEIGEGKRKSEDIITILKEEDRRKAGKTASPEGLYLKDVLY
ncbi:MAG: tRNA pseudouridine(38-40) synthase TruA [Bacilli bacterium]|nr:tRNA pseudouridine(38-40) synthase TruA [Bacilli bacterium]MCI9585192.1 tRNA pseudouridine(38-40) synthase TruA [Bacilli bacterium]